MLKFKTLASASIAALLFVACSSGPDMDEASFAINNAAGERIGTLELEQRADGGVAIEVELSSLEPGIHAMHFHEVGRCDAPDFKTAGGHYNPTFAWEDHCRLSWMQTARP
jgi:Cu-Zn family superoxide dismutase